MSYLWVNGVILASNAQINRLEIMLHAIDVDKRMKGWNIKITIKTWSKVQCHGVCDLNR